MSPSDKEKPKAAAKSTKKAAGGSKRNQARLDALAGAGSAHEEDVPAQSTQRKGVLATQSSVLGRLASGKQKAVMQLMHPPGRVRIWSEHDRDYASLDASSCADLVDGFRRAGQQEFAAIVRKLASDDPDRDGIDYELICGARRHWTAGYLGWDLLVEVRDLNDRQAFVLLDLENRDRVDVSDYERALNYKRALPKFFGNERQQMAKELDIHPSLFGRILDLADLPVWLVKAYRDRAELKVHHGTAYKKLLNDAGAKRRMRDAVNGFGDSAPDGNTVFRALKKAGAPKKPVPKRRTRDKYGNIAVDEGANGNATLRLPPPSKLKAKDLDGIRKSFEAFLRDYEKAISDD
jgi:ParB family chromosome partitioning protein